MKPFCHGLYFFIVCLSAVFGMKNEELRIKNLLCPPAAGGLGRKRYHSVAQLKYSQRQALGFANPVDDVADVLEVPTECARGVALRYSRLLHFSF